METTAAMTSPLTSPVASPFLPRILRRIPSRAILLVPVALLLALYDLSALAQIVADRSAPAGQQPTILNAANGVPQVNIQTPSAAGVSRNTYTQFDVQRQGAILNNSRTNAQTQLGGWVQGNPWLAAGTARVILNEVNSSNPSLLKGYIEVAGDRAQVVIANPSGVTCDGCGFINANRNTLTTGTPLMNGGSLDGYRVQGGTVIVTGAGLDASRSDYTDIIARAVQINAGLWANDLRITTGSGQVNAANTQATPAAPGSSGGAPAFALDVSALGGMYAGKITLIGTEAGVGVRNAGEIGASAGSVTVTAAGWLQNSGRITASDQVRIAAQGDLQNAGTLYAQGDAALSAANIDNGSAGGGVIAAAGNLTLAATGATGRIDNHDGATLAAGLLADGSLGGHGQLTLAAVGDIDNLAGRIVAQGDLTLSAANLDNRQGTLGAATGNAAIDLGSGSLDNRAGLVSAGGGLTLNAASVNNANTQGAGQGIEGASLTLNAATLLNQSGALRADTAIALNLSTRLDNTQGSISSQGSLVLLDTAPTAKSLAIANDGGTLIGGLGLTLDAASLSGGGSLLSGAAMTVGLDQDFLNTGTVQANGDVRFQTAGVLSNQALIQAGGSLVLKAATLDNQSAGQMLASRLQLQATDTHTFTNRGLIDGQDTFIDAVTLNNLGSGRIYGDHVALAATTLNNLAENGTAPVIAARQQLDIGAGAITNSEHALIYSAGDLAIGGGLDADHHATGQAATLTNSSATIEAGGNLALAVGQIGNLNAHFATTTVSLPSDYIVEYSIAGSPNRWLPDQVDVRPDPGESTTTLYTPDGANSNYYRFNYTRSYTQTQVVESDPGQILAGGGMSISADALTNDNSRILAGGALTGNIGSLTNNEATGLLVTTDSGYQYYFSYKHHGSSGRTEHIDTSGYTPAPTVQTISLNSGAYAGNTASGAGGQQIRSFALDAGSSQSAAGRQGLGGGSGPFAVPNSALYTLHPGATSHYLIETDPAFASYKTWLSSDYMLTALSLDPAQTQKRLGDGAYEQRLVQEQVAELTGRRYLSGFTDDQAQYQALMSAGVTYAQSHSLTPGVALTAAQIAQLTSDIVWLVSQTVTLPDGSTTQVLVPQLYVQVKAGDVTGGGALIAADSTQLHVSGDLINGGTIAGRSVLNLSADNLKNLGGTLIGKQVSLVAQTDLDNLGGRIEAGDSLALQAGRDLTVASTTASSANSQGSRTNVDRIAGLYVDNPNGVLVASAGQDLSLIAAQVQNLGGGATQLTAGRDLVLGTVTETYAQRSQKDSNNYRAETRSQDVGSTLQTQGALTLAAGRDLTATAATLESTQGALTLAAARDVSLLSGQDSLTLNEAAQLKSSGAFSSTTRTRRDSLDQMNALGSSLSGATVQVQAGNDLKLAGGNIVSDSGTTLVAGHDLSLDTAATRHNETHYQATRTSGLFSGGGVGVTLGSQAMSTDTRGQGAGVQGSTVGSISGDVTLLAGNGYKQVGSDVVAPQGDVTIQGKSVDIVAATETQQTVTETQFKQSGITASIGSPLITAVQIGQQMSQAASQTSDGRMQALAAAAAGLNLYNNAKGIQDSAQALINGKPQDAVSISLSVGSSKSQSTSTSQSSTTKSSTVTAGNDLSIQATGGGNTPGDLNVVGSTLTAGNNALLAAANNVNLLAAANTSSQQSSSSGNSGSIGVSLGAQTGITLAASQSKGNSNGQDTTYTDTTVNAGNGAVLVSGLDTNLRGAQVNAKQIVADVGRNLNLETLQDSSTYQSKSSNSGFSLTVSPTGVPMGGNVGGGNSKIDSDYRSVNQQSGFQAGDGGFQVNVGGNTDLKGAVIASTQKAVDDGKNSFTTGGSLTLSDLQNQASYKGNAVGVNIGAGVSTDGKLAPQGTSAGVGQAEGSASSTTTAGISGIAGDKDVRTGDSANGIQKIFDAEKVQKDINAQVAITQQFGLQASKAVDTYVTTTRKALQDQLKKAETDADKAAIQKELNDLRMQEQALNILVGAVTGMGGAAVTKEALSAAAEKMRDLMIADSIKFAGVTDSTGRIISNVSGPSDGVRNDEKKIGGTRIDLDLLCGPANERCVFPMKSDGTIDTSKPVIFTGGMNSDGTPKNQSLADFIKTPEGQKMLGATGGLQGDKGTLFGMSYAAGSWQDKLIEAFSGSHDMIGGKLSGLYDEQGNIKRGMSATEKTLYDRWAEAAIPLASPFAAAELMPPEVWKAVGILLGVTP